MRPNQTFHVLEDLRNSFSGPLYREGVRLSPDDSRTVVDVYQQWLLLMIDLGYLLPDSLLRDARRLLSSMLSADVLDLNNAFAELLALVRNQSQDFKGFKALCSRISTHLYAFVKDDLVTMMQGDVYSAKRLVQLFSYTSRLSLNDIDLTQQCLVDYMKVEDNMPSEFPSSIIRTLNSYIKNWMKFFDSTSLRPKHGPRGVAGHGRTSLEVKYYDLTYDDRLTYAFGDPIWSDGPVRSTLDRISQTIFVPKSYKTFRTISMESPTLQYFQQSVWKEIERVVARSPFLRNRIGFSEQTRNQRLAKEGSIHRNYATIDLSAASDSVSHALVKKLFRGTKLPRYLLATRSSRTLLPDGRLVDLKKFAPMGSALCFPIETIIFASICQLVTRRHGFAEDYSVFGDDIIVPTQCVEDLVSILTTLGFRVNRDKSFYRSDCWFRESCGAEYCDGFDVTPMRVSRKYDSKDGEDVRLSGLVDLANAAYEKGFRNLRHFFLDKLRKSDFIPMFGPNHLLGDNYTNYHTKTRWNKDLQRDEVWATGLATSQRARQDESIRLRHWFESTSARLKADDGFFPYVGRTTVVLRKRWMSDYLELQDQKLYRDDQGWQ